MEFLSLPPAEAEYTVTKDAYKGTGSHELPLYSTLCGRSNGDTELLIKPYYKAYTEDPSKIIGFETSGFMNSDLGNQLSVSLQATEEAFAPDYNTDQKVKSDAEQIQVAKENSLARTNQGYSKW